MTREASYVRATALVHMSFESMVAYAKGRYCVDPTVHPNCERTVGEPQS